MEVVKATVGSEGKEMWISLKGQENIIVHVVSDIPMMWNKSGSTLNILPKR
jgi:hypothetical protein